MSASKKMRELNRARIEHDKSRLMAAFAESRKEMVSLVGSALAGKVDELMQQLASRDAEIARLKTIPMRYRRMAFNAQLQDEIAELEQENDQLRAKIKQKDAEIAELVAALEDNWNCNPCETTRQQKAFDVAQSVLAKVRKP